MRMVDALTEGKWLWCAAFGCLVRNSCARINMDLLIYWFEAICTNFQRLLEDASMRRSYDGLLWTLRYVYDASSGVYYAKFAAISFIYLLILVAVEVFDTKNM
jgi:ataxia telangiectasia mutated family protein